MFFLQTYLQIAWLVFPFADIVREGGAHVSNKNLTFSNIRSARKNITKFRSVRIQTTHDLDHTFYASACPPLAATIFFSPSAARLFFNWP